MRSLKQLFSVERTIVMIRPYKTGLTLVLSPPASEALNWGLVSRWADRAESGLILDSNRCPRSLQFQSLTSKAVLSMSSEWMGIQLSNQSWIPSV